MRNFWIMLGIVLLTIIVIMLINVLIFAAKNGFQWGDIERIPENIRKEEKIELNEIDTIKLNFKTSDIKVMITDEPELKIIQYSNKKLEEKELFYTSKNNKEITVKETKQDFKFTFNIFNMYRMAYDIYIPKNYEGNIFIESVSGDINIDEEIKLNNAEIKTTSGDIVFSKTVNANELKIKTVSGEIKLDKVNSNELVLEATSGDIEVTDIINSVEIKSVSGDISVDNGNGKMLLESTSGDITAYNFTVKEQSKIKTVSGDIKTNINKESNCKINTSTTSGDIKLPNGINVMGNEPYVEIYLQTVSGDIKVD